jgi:hypothetical protein
VSQLAHYYFSPAVRRGLASAIDADATGPRAVIQVRADLTASGAGDDKKSISQEVQIYGPGDILGFDARIVVRTDPRVNVGDFEPNFLPAVDFADPDFPWRFSPVKAAADGSLKPWIALVVLEATEFTFASKGAKGVPPSISVAKGCLPDMARIALWAHVHMTGSDGFSCEPEAHGAKLTEAEETAPESVVSRLLCGRRLKPATSYHAFVVPTFKLGCVAAGLAQLGSGEGPLSPAWTAGAEATLPYYYDWQFGTGQKGDFEYLVRLLQPKVLTGLGVRPMDCSQPGFGMNASAPKVLAMEGALRSLDTKFTAWGKDQPPGTATPFQVSLQQLLNKSANDLEAAKKGAGTREEPAVPSVVPPVYGSWFAARNTVDPRRNPTTWLDELNLDPRHRAVAGFAALVVQQQQEALMASAWDQLDEIEKANAVLRHGQMGREAASALHKRLEGIPDEHLVGMTSPLHSHVRSKEGEPSVAGRFSGGGVPRAAMDPALRRMRGPSGPTVRQAAPSGAEPKTGMLDRLKSGALSAAGIHPKPVGRMAFGHLTVAHAKAAGVAPAAAGKSAAGSAKHLLEEHITASVLRQDLSATGAVPHLPAGVKLGSLRDAACHALDSLPKSPVPAAAAAGSSAPLAAAAEVDVGSTATTLRSSLDPRKTVHERVLARLQIQLPKVVSEAREGGDPLGQIFASPDFPQPMYEALRDISQELILPGIETVPQNTVAVLKTNRRFVEAYLIGLNHAFTGELLWRGAPVGGRYTYFRQFWNVDDAVAGHRPTSPEAEREIRKGLKDIKPITWWGNSRLGENGLKAEGGAKPDPLVLLVRGDLLKKYPNTRVYAIKAVKLPNGRRVPALPEFKPPQPSEPVAPVFHGSLAPDLTFFGFGFTEEEARGAPGTASADGVFFVFEERISEARFGLDELMPGRSPGAMSSWDDLTWGHLGVAGGAYLDSAKPSAVPANAAGASWGASSAAMARITFQKPVRIAVHADRMLPAKPAAKPR